MDLSLSATGTDYYIEYNMIQNCKKKEEKEVTSSIIYYLRVIKCHYKQQKKVDG